MSRTKNQNVSLSHDSVIKFFEQRAATFNPTHPLVTTMYQDKNPELAERRDAMERARITPLLALTGKETVLDVGCGIGRWLSALHDQISLGVGIDASEGLVNIARHMCPFENVTFINAGIDDLEDIFPGNEIQFDRILLMGIIMYLNDDQLALLFAILSRILAPGGILCLREPVGVQGRLSLKDHWSEDLQSYYSAIYRTPEEIQDILTQFFPNEHYRISGFSPLFVDPDVNRWAETQQQFCLVRHQGASA